MGDEVRRSRRKRVFAMKVWCHGATSTAPTEYRSHDVSAGGTFIKTAAPLPPGTILKFELRLAAEPHPIRGVARVVWVREDQAASLGHPAGMGLKFLKIDELSKSAILRLA